MASPFDRCLWILIVGSLSVIAPLGVTERFAAAQDAPLTADIHAEDNAAVETETNRAPVPEDELDSTDKPTAESTSEASGLVRMSKTDEVWIDMQRKRVVVGGRISLREGVLEMFACPAGTKEYESIVAVNSKAYVVHTALLAVGAEPGTPVQWEPEYRPATGDMIDVHVVWEAADGTYEKHRAQELVYNMKTEQTMQEHWVFAGSQFWQEEPDSKRYYMAEAGELICLSNFSTATMDLPVASTQDNQNLLFRANTEKLPPLGTEVRLLLSPRKADKNQAAEQPRQNDPSDQQPTATRNR